ncbi:uncharacterized protein LOC128996180 isoform X1 [Macrosteles quadrilineatus]|uniref:uncharacterized protein LOC128996180 isoform X1 n=1 Tax=Macrosteles quadrilineatus TaxID=74068 RepID=UPI0023E20010|nr:uncharacterized protein LOC128996180 isoform X1 [Macrosteles quadrilineatus]
MSETWKRTLSLPHLPKKLSSRRNLHAYFSKFGEVQGTNVNKDNKSGVVVFASHAEAKAAKIHGKIYENKPLKILWFENALETTETRSDPRATDKEDVIDVDDLYSDDDKECFGVEKVAAVSRKKLVKELIKPQANLLMIKKRLGSLIKTNVMDQTDDSESDKSSVLVRKSQPKIAMKKVLASKRKLLKKEGLMSAGLKKTSTIEEVGNPTVAVPESLDLKHKLSMLDERDKLIRQQTVKDSDIKTAVSIKGTCPDMCPERERIIRQIGHQIAVYESLPGTNEMDENRAIKEYSRSSADQNVPLPHELRPAPVLSMTMSYLITNIINQIDNPNENKSVWFSFCWNRLRSIRKDITLQQLCDLETVTIIEQCARFHICCYDLMWGLEVSSGFDDKINTNNLIDCLQTLKHLYEDLAKHNVKCPNEPEFHGYLILLKLTVGDVFWEYQQYAPEIQFSSKVQFAIEVYMAFLNNMYSKYFGLVKKASYLEACLLQRHFDQVRTKALKMMLKAYSHPNRNVSLTTSFLVDCLKFDSRKNVIQFCEKIESQLDKKIDFEEDDIEDEYISTSSYLIVDKRLPIANAIVGENQPLPVYIPHQVHSSFDDEGNLREPIQSAPDEFYSSYDSPCDETDTSVPDVKTETLSQNQPFKFSLSPKVTQEPVFSQSVFSRLGKKLDTPSSKKLFETNLTEFHSSKFEFGTKVDAESDKSFYDEDQSEPFDMQEDTFEEMICDEDFEVKAKEETIKPLQFAGFDPAGKSLFGNLQAFSSPPTMPVMAVNNNSTFHQGSVNQPSNIFSAANNSQKLQKETNFQFSLTSKPIISGHLLSKTSEKSPVVSKTHIQPVSAHVDYHSGKIKAFSMFQSETKPLAESEVKTLVGFPVKKSLEKHQDSTKIAMKQEQEILERKLLEEERLRIEEAKRAELERKKRDEKQKELDKLRKDLSERMKAKNAKKYLRLWKTRIEKLKKKRADFPMLQQLSVEDHLRLWGRMKSIPTTGVFQRAKDRQNLDNILSHLLKYGVNNSCIYIGKELAELLAKSVAKTMDMGSVRPVFWKLAMSLPWKDRSTPIYSVFNQMMRRCCRETFYSKTGAQLGSVESLMTSLQIPVHITVHVWDDLLSSSHLKGMDALVFVVADGFESEKSCLDRLRCLVTKQARGSELAVSVMTINGSKFNRVLKMELEELQEQGHVAYWSVNEWTNSSCLLKNLAFLTKHVSVAKDICARPLGTLVRETIEDFIFSVDSSQVYCTSLMDAVENPNVVINVYNTFLTKLEDLLLSRKLEKYFDFAEEFKSHIPPSEFGGPELMCGKQYDYQYKSQISDTIKSLKLPELPGWPADTNLIDFDTLAELLETYCMTQLEDREVYKEVIRKLAFSVSHPPNLLNSYSWLHIVGLFAESRFSQVFVAKKEKEKMFVIYNKRDLQLMINNQWWIELPIVVNACK